MKNCSDGSSYQYLVDPFGLFGADIMAEINQVYSYNYNMLELLELANNCYKNLQLV